MAIKKPTTSSERINDSLDEVDGNGTTKEIPIEDLDEKPETVTADFQDEEIANQFASKPTKPSKDEESIDPNTSAEKLQEDIKNYEESKSGKLEYKDFYKIAEFLITLLDTTVSTALNWFAKDTSTSAYSLPNSNKKLLTEQLALVLAKYQTKFSIEFTFFMGLLLLYAPSFLAAFNKRKEKNKKAPKEEKNPNEPYYRHDSDNEIKDNKTKIEHIPDKINVPFKRRPGKQPKAYNEKK